MLLCVSYLQPAHTVSFFSYFTDSVFNVTSFHGKTILLQVFGNPSYFSQSFSEVVQG